jgi:hypothetical protein
MLVPLLAVCASLPLALALSVGAPIARTGPAGASTTFAGDGVSGFGSARTYGTFAGTSLSAPAVGIAATPSGAGYWVAAADGGVFTFGDAQFYGSTGNLHLNAPVVGVAGTADGKGYWLVALDGGIFAYGDAAFDGSMGAVTLNQPVVGMTATPDGKGYWLVASDGGIFAFGDAAFYGSMGAVPLNEPVAGIAATHDGRGYWMVAADGGIFAFGDAAFFGSAANAKIGTWVTGIAPTLDGAGYWLVAATAGVLPYGDAKFLGPTPNLPPFSPTTAIVAAPKGNGYWLLQPDDITTTFTNPSTGAVTSIVQAAASQIGPDPDADRGTFCNPYGPCEQWCALFATWSWEQAGVTVPRYAFTGDIYRWGAARGLSLGPGTRPASGDAVLFGTGPTTATTSTHVGIVAQVWPDGAIDTVEGDAGPEPNGKFATVINGPFLPALSAEENGEPVYAYVRP